MIMKKNKYIIIILLCFLGFCSCAKREQYEGLKDNDDTAGNTEEFGQNNTAPVIDNSLRKISDSSGEAGYIERQIGESFNGIKIKAKVFYPDKICTGTVNRYLPVSEVKEYFEELYSLREGDRFLGKQYEEYANVLEGNWIVSNGDEDLYEITVFNGKRINIDTLTEKNYMFKLNGSEVLHYSDYDETVKKQTDEYEKLILDICEKNNMDVVITDHQYEANEEYFHNWIFMQPEIYGGAVINGSNCNKLNDINVEFINDGIFGAVISEFYLVDKSQSVEVYSVDSLINEIERRFYQGEISPVRNEVKYIRLAYMVDSNDNFKPVWTVGIGFPKDDEYIVFIFDAQTLEILEAVQ
ncbi:hypothetical protein SAMN04487934_1174 [Eubacterium ruminantium]|nr:hypothetical protein SAMN04487934_1174 [Eubacterium ruminantium]